MRDEVTERIRQTERKMRIKREGRFIFHIPCHHICRCLLKLAGRVPAAGKMPNSPKTKKQNPEHLLRLVRLRWLITLGRTDSALILAVMTMRGAK